MKATLRPRPRLATRVLLPLALAACSPPPAPPAPQLSRTATPDPAAPPPMASPVADATALLPAYHWQLAAASDAGGQRLAALLARPDTPVQLDFVGNRLAVTHTCNRMSGHFRLQDGTLTAGPLASTLMACADPALAALDAELGRRLAGALAVSAIPGDTPELVLTNAGGDRLVFQGTPTAATRFGGPAERIFLEVAPETKPCSHPPGPDPQCLQVREVRFDDNGLRRRGPGPWQILSVDIEGYTHHPGVRNVLRIDRYTRTGVPADASRHAYVLDLVIESEQVTR